MAANELIKSLGTAAAVLGIIQGLTWAVLAAIAIILHLEVWEPQFEEATHGELLGQMIISTYLIGGKAADLFVGPQQFFVVCIFYVFISIVWTVLSFYLISSVNQQHYHRLLKRLCIGWAVWTALVCIVDIVLMAFLAADYSTIAAELNAISVIAMRYAKVYHLLACGVVMMLAARGFVLWCINCTFVVIVAKLSMGLQQKKAENKIDTSTIDAFRQPNTPGSGVTNPAFNWDDGKPDFTRSNSFVSPPPKPAGAPQRMPQLPPISSTNERLAKIGKQGRNSPPQNVAPPKLPQTYIYPTLPRVPSPDYSPPSSPVGPPLKSALKNRTQNVYGYQNGRY